MGAPSRRGETERAKRLLFVRRAQRDGREVVQQGDVVFDAQLHHRRFLLAADGFNAAIKLLAISVTETFGEQAQYFALFRRQAFIAIAAGADFFQQARDAFRGEFLPFLQRGQRFWQVGRRPLLEDDPSISRSSTALRIAGLLFMVRTMIDRSGKWRLMYLISVIPSPYLSPGMDRSVISTWASSFGRLLIRAVESSNSPTTFTHSICSSDLRIPNSTIGWSSAIITFIVFMYKATFYSKLLT